MGNRYLAQQIRVVGYPSAATVCSPNVRSMLDLTQTLPNTEAARKGYDPAFLSTPVDVPAIDAILHDDTVTLDGSHVVPYTHFSLALSKSRRFARWVGWNIDGADLKRLSRTDIQFTKDPRIPAEFQTGNELYRSNRVDRGHIARRADLLWGPVSEAQRANTDSFFYTNITPQMDDFNQSAREGLWGKLEDAVFAEVDVQDLRISVFGGPVFRDDDRVYRTTKVPREFFKILVFVEKGALKARAFLLTQNLDELEALALDEFRVYQVTVGEVEERTGLRFADEIRVADAFAAFEAIGPRQPLDTMADIRW